MNIEQRQLFDGPRSEEAKQIGMDRAALSKPEILALAREIAVGLAADRPDGITMDDVTLELVSRGHDIHCLGNSAGSVFKTGGWICVGMRKSIRIHAHSNLLRIWVIK